MNTTTQSRLLRYGLPGLLLAMATAAYWQLKPRTESHLALDCPAGYSVKDPLEYARDLNPQMTDEQADLIRQRYGERACAYNRLPDP